MKPQDTIFMYTWCDEDYPFNLRPFKPLIQGYHSFFIALKIRFAKRLIDSVVHTITCKNDVRRHPFGDVFKAVKEARPNKCSISMTILTKPRDSFTRQPQINGFNL